MPQRRGGVKWRVPENTDVGNLGQAKKRNSRILAKPANVLCFKAVISTALHTAALAPQSGQFSKPPQDRPTVPVSFTYLSCVIRARRQRLRSTKASPAMRKYGHEDASGPADAKRPCRLVGRGASGHDVIDEKNGLSRERSRFAAPEGVVYVGTASRRRQRFLLGDPAGAAQPCGPARNAQDTCDGMC